MADILEIGIEWTNGDITSSFIHYVEQLCGLILVEKKNIYMFSSIRELFALRK